MQIRTKLTLGACALAGLSVAFTAFILGSVAIDKGREALLEARKSQLLSTRDMTKSELESYLHTLRKQILTYSDDTMIIDAAKDFGRSFSNFKSSGATTDIPRMRETVTGYYEQQFATTYAELNAGARPDFRALLGRLDDDSIALQHHYIAANPFALGEKDGLDTAGDSSKYGEHHAYYHPRIRHFLKEFGYYDIFIADPDSGDIVYSVFKELDFSTSLINGPYADAAIGRAFKEANAATSLNAFVVTDLAPYFPSYEAQAAFMASPIFDGTKKVGVLIFQMPVDRINAVLTHHQNWQQFGLGKTGEAYLIGRDMKARSPSRLLIEDKARYLDLLQEQQVGSEVIKDITNRNSNIGLQRFDTQAASLALRGETAFGIFENTYGESALTAYTPVDFPGLEWFLISEMHESEALASADQLRSDIISSGSLTTVLIAFVGLVLGLYFAFTISRPIRETVDTLENIAEGEGDLTQRLPEGRNDEIGALACAFNRFCQKLQSTITDINHASEEVERSAQTMSRLTKESDEGFIEQRRQIEQVASAMGQMASSVEDVAENASSAEQVTQQARQSAANGADEVSATTSAIAGVAQEVERVSAVIQNLEEDSAAIGSVIDVIRGIADQTNLLALNAAIEAARAGEQGRGFAVVADEVRTLANKTQESTQEIHEIIERLQNGTREAVSAMQSGEDKVRLSVEQADRANNALNDITQSVTAIADINSRIASAAEEQSVVARQINDNTVEIANITEQVTAGAEKSSATSVQVDQLAASLKALVNQFKV